MAHSLELREWAISILSADTLENKLHSPLKLTDYHPGPPLLWDEPSRPIGMELCKRKKSEKLPPLHDLHDPNKRAICLHRFAGHELLAVEIMAYTLLACPEAPPHFRKGLANTLKEEQEHVRLYMEEMQHLGIQFGDLPLYRHFWAHTRFITHPAHYVSTMCLTLEMANLDFAPIYKSAFERFEATSSAALMQRILDDEIGHVSFGYNWLKKFKPPEKSAYQMWTESLSPLMTPRRARGPIYHPDHRRQAGIDEEWIHHLCG
ncbi:MAG TPA: DUF455 family protein [Chlamydiales bacterium]|nr:DUF455 family protein [Chlamydiales bacterium]